MKKKKIIAIVGNSGSGKDTVVDMLRTNHNVPSVVSYTTRKIREGETDGVEHFFVNKDDVPQQSEMFAYTVYGNYEYWTSISSIQKLLAQHSTIAYIVDEPGVHTLRNTIQTNSIFKDVEVLVVYVRASAKQISNRNVSKNRMARDSGRTKVDWDFILTNDGTLEDLKQSVEILINKIVK